MFFVLYASKSTWMQGCPSSCTPATGFATTYLKVYGTLCFAVHSLTTLQLLGHPNFDLALSIILLAIHNALQDHGAVTINSQVAKHKLILQLSDLTSCCFLPLYWISSFVCRTQCRFDANSHALIGDSTQTHQSTSWAGWLSLFSFSSSPAPKACLLVPVIHVQLCPFSMCGPDTEIWHMSRYMNL